MQIQWWNSTTLKNAHYSKPGLHELSHWENAAGAATKICLELAQVFHWIQDNCINVQEHSRLDFDSEGYAVQQLPSSQWHRGTAKVWKYVFCLGCTCQGSTYCQCAPLANKKPPATGDIQNSDSCPMMTTACIYIASQLEVPPFAGTVDVCAQYLHLSTCKTVAACQVKDQAKPAALTKSALKTKSNRHDYHFAKSAFHHLQQAKNCLWRILIVMMVHH